MKYLIWRHGGCGDLAPITCVGRILKSRGHQVDLIVRDGGPDSNQPELLIDNPSFDNVFGAREVGPQRVRAIKTQMGWIEPQVIYKDYDVVVDYRNSIEGNSTSPYNQRGPRFAWQQSRNSNWRNWYDLSLEWANIDPTSVPDEEKRPNFNLLEGEEKLFQPMRDNFDKIFVVQPYASSLARTWYQAKALPKLLTDKYDNSIVLIWNANENCWYGFTKKGSNRVDPLGSPMRFSMAMISKADLFIGVDTGYSHVAEGLGIKNLVMYGTVPSWTRAKYYKFQTPIDPGIEHPEFYSFSLSLGDPNRVIEGIDAFSVRERKLYEGIHAGSSPEELMEEMNTTKEGIQVEYNALKARLHSFEHQQSQALSLVTPKLVMEHVERIIQ
jgi:Glycosyltransferase family 9 (heptosyltransferase)